MILNTDMLIYIPKVKLIINKSIINGSQPIILDSKKNSLTTPSGKIKEIINPKAELIIAPQIINRSIKW